MKATADDLNLFEQLKELEDEKIHVRIYLEHGAHAVNIFIYSGHDIKATGSSFTEAAVRAISAWKDINR